MHSHGEQAGLLVGALTWRDEAAPLSWPLREDRGQVVVPDSVGVMVCKHQQEGRLASPAADGLILSTGRRPFEGASA